jgi:uncharacterized protein YndB with AHSA1/START domain
VTAPRAPQAEPLELELRVAASPETVFAFFTDPERYIQWQGVSADLDPRPGGIYRVVMTEASVVIGEFVEVEPPRRLVFTWGFEGSEEVAPGSSTVEVTLEPDGDHTIVRLRHSGLPTDEWRGVHREGWETYLGQLASAAS